MGGVLKIWHVKLFETVPVIKGYTNKMEFNLIEFNVYMVSCS